MARSPRSWLVVAWLLTACGPRVFEAESAKVIESLPPPVVEEEPEPEPRVEVADDKIVIHEKIMFEHNAATIRAESDDLLAEIARVINENPQLEKIRVEGHASSDGGYRHNVKLSKKRAMAVVDHLVERGEVDAARLESEGYGPDRPIRDNETQEGREANRRVEFTILDRSQAQTVETEGKPK